MGAPKFSGPFSPQNGPIRTNYLEASAFWAVPRACCGCPLPPSHPALTPIPPQEVGSAGFSENIQGIRPSAEARCSQLGTPPPLPAPSLPPHTHSAVSAGTSGPRGRGPAGELQSLGNGTSQAPVEGSLSSSPSTPARPWGGGGGTCGKAPCGQRPSQLPQTLHPILPLGRI